MKQYRVKITFNDSEGEHKAGSLISLSFERAQKLISLGKVKESKPKTAIAEATVSALEEITVALEDAAKVIEVMNDELNTLKTETDKKILDLETDLDKTSEAYRAIIFSLIEAKTMTDVEDIVKLHSAGTSDVNEENDG